MNPSQEREDEDQDTGDDEYCVTQIAPPESSLPRPTLLEQLAGYGVLFLLLLVVWLLVRGFYLAGRELVHFL